MRHGIDFAINRCVGLDAVEQLGLHRRGVNLRQIKRLVDVVFLLHGIDTVVAWLGQIESCATGGTQLGDHFLVVRESHLNSDIRILRLKLLYQFVRSIGAPCQKAQGLCLCRHRCHDCCCQKPGHC